jgi:hypothetical protein
VPRVPRRKKDAITGKPRPDWIAIKAMYLAGAKFRDLAKQFKVPEGTVKSRAYRFNWLGGELSPRVIKKVQTQLENKATENIEQLWRDRSLQVREAEYQAAQRILDFTTQMEDQELLLKVEKIKTAADMGRRATGLEEKQTSSNAINIAVLSDIDFLSAESKLFLRNRTTEIDAEFSVEKSGNP